MNNFNILSTAISSDKKLIYILSAYEKSIEDLSALTYSISICNLNNTITVNDVSTDEKQCQNLLKLLAERNISMEFLNDFIVDYLSEN